MKKFSLTAVLLLAFLGCSDSGPATSPQALAVRNAMFKESQSPVSEPTAPNSQRPPAEAIPRKIIYTGGIDLLVGDLSGTASKLDELVKEFHGLVAHSQINSDPGSPRSGTWRVRIPIDRFTDFVNQIAKLGEAIKNKTDSEDITDKFFDFQVRIENKKVQVERLQKIIKEQTGKISELLEAERELGRVTTELEELKGTVKLWENQTALATVDITVHERTQYVAPKPPSFAGNISNTFRSSLDGLIVFVETLVLILVAVTPWLPVIAIACALCWLLLRRANRRPAAPRHE
jgi:hypothetical protein